MAEPSNLTLATNLVTAPNEAFASLRERPRALFPVLVLLALYSVVQFYYFSHVDMGWLLDNQLQASGANIPEAQRQQVVTQVSKVPPVIYGAGTAVAVDFLLLFVILIGALYFTLVSVITSDGVTLKHWFTLLCWCLLPQALGQTAAIVNMLINDPRFMFQDSINPLAFGNLLSIDRAAASPTQRSLLAIDVTAVWGLVLQVIGYQSFSKSSLTKAAAVVLGPVVVIALIVTLLALRR